jgi:hypothetical protein
MKFILAAFLLSALASAQTDAQPNLQGIWYSGTGTPLERPAELASKAFFASDAEAIAWLRNKTAKSRTSTEADPVGSYNDLFWEPGTTVKTRRTSMIVEPPDGKLPPLTPQAREEWIRKQNAMAGVPNGPEDRSLRERCLIFPTGAPPMIPYQYNSNYQIIQSKNEVVIEIELNHEVRIIHLDRREHLPASIHLWTGDSIGRWEGNTLVVDTTNLTGKNDGLGTDENLHVIERFSRMDGGTLLYQWTVDDPTAFTRPWKGEYTMTATASPIYEYACHEGNYALADILQGARATEKAVRVGTR